MTKKLPPIYFYCPSYKLFANHMPKDADDSWQWLFNEGKPKYALADEGEYAWVLQTYLRLTEAGFPCQMIATIPEEGIVLAHRFSLPFDLQPSRKILLICLQADKAPHPYAQLSVVLNPGQLYSQYSYLGDVHAPKYLGRRKIPYQDRYYIPHWILPALVPRDSARGDRFENVVFFGVGRSLAPELRDPSWRQQIQAMGLNWYFRGYGERVDSWTNFSDVDVVLAVRQFNRQDCYDWKPSTKLYNAWHAGVPAILGWESAYRAERKSELDYIEVVTVAEALAAIERLRDDKAFRQAIVENGQQRAQETTPVKLVAQWRKFLEEVAVPTYERWRVESGYRKAFLQRRYLALTRDRIRRYLEFKIEGVQRRFNLVTETISKDF